MTGGATMAQRNRNREDRRTRYTKMVIKEALLTLLSENDYGSITVADICRTAEISRGTFYLHYSNIPAVLDELLEEALNSSHSVLAQIGCETASDEKCGVPLCRFLRENKKYQPLFFSDSLRSLVIDRVSHINEDKYVERLRTQTGLTDKTIHALFYFQLNGCLAISKQNVNIPDEEWSEIQCHVDRFLRNGFDNL